MAKKESKKSQGGFTLIELMIVIGIIGILAAIAIPAYNAYKEQSYVSVCVSDSKNAYTAAQSYFMFQCDQWLNNIGQLYAHGFKESTGVTSIVVPGKQQPHNLEIKSTHDTSGVSVTRSVDGYTVTHWMLG